MLQTRVRIERGADGRWTILAGKNAASDELLRSFVAKLLGQASRKPAP